MSSHRSAVAGRTSIPISSVICDQDGLATRNAQTKGSVRKRSSWNVNRGDMMRIGPVSFEPLEDDLLWPDTSTSRSASRSILLNSQRNGESESCRRVSSQLRNEIRKSV